MVHISEKDQKGAQKQYYRKRYFILLLVAVLLEKIQQKQMTFALCVYLVLQDIPPRMQRELTKLSSVRFASVLCMLLYF